MQKMYQAIIDSLKKGQNVVVATIISERGSTPRSSGTKMLIFPDSSIHGTIGGGSLEAKIIASALEAHKTGQSSLVEFRLTGKDAALSDMICGGNGDVLLQFLDATDSQLLQIFEAALNTSLNKRKGWIISQIPLKSGKSALCFVDEDQNHIGSLDIPASELQEMTLKPLNISLHSGAKESGNMLVEQVHRKKTAFIFGGGHVSLEIVSLANNVDFQTVIIEDRAEFAGTERFPQSESILVESYSELPPLPIEEDSFIVIVTRGHLGDYDVLNQMLRTNAGYIGMIGSKTKRDLIYQRLLKEGTAQKDIDRVHSPIGLAIKAETPAEIAVSIVAEMILSRQLLANGEKTK